MALDTLTRALHTSLRALHASLKALKTARHQGLGRRMPLWLLVTGSFCPVSAAAELRGAVELEARYFTSPARSGKAFDRYDSLVLRPEMYFANEQGNHSLTFAPFYREDSHDAERSHGDVRELYWLYQREQSEFSAGIRKVFWGTTESRHLVDVINQTDLVENPDTEDKLGQPMLSTTLFTGRGVWEAYLLPYFRERTFPAADGRLQFIPAISFRNDPLYETKDGKKHSDYALRWSGTLGYWDIGVSHFYGTNREPLFLPDVDSGVYRPYYELMHQTALDVQGASGAWLWKLEAIYRDTDSMSFAATTAGVEYTWSQVGDSAVDVGLVAEYLYDGRDVNTTAFKHDLMLGIRLSPNDLQGTELLFGVIEDLEDNSRFYRLEAGRRLTDHLRFSLEATVFSGFNTGEIFSNLRDDDFIQAQLSWYF